MKDESHINEQLLIEAIQDGKKYAFEYLFREYYKRLCLYAQKYVRDHDTAEEIVSRLFEKLWKKRKHVQIETSLTAYLFQSVYHEALNYLNSFSHRQRPTDSIYSYLREKEMTGSFLPQLYRRELEEKIEQAVNNLPEKCRTIFHLSRYQGYSHKEIAEELGISVRTVENQIGIALEKLRIDLNQKQG